MKFNRRRVALIGAVATLVLVALGCKQEPVEGEVFLGGDSTMWLGNFYGGGFPPEWQEHFDLGWRASHAQPALDAAVADAALSPEVVVLGFGHNYVRTGMSTADRQELEKFATTAHQDACVVLVLPAYVGTDARHTLVIAAYKNWARNFAEARPDHRVIVDWPATAEQHPEWYQSDGIHSYDQDAGREYIAAVTAGVAECVALVRS